MSGNSTAVLFEPIEVGALRLPHRIVLAPMARYRCSESGVPLDIVRQYYEQRASAALIIGETVYCHPTGRIAPFVGGFSTDEQIAAWSAVVSGVHALGGRMFIQLMHGGRVCHPSLLPDNRPPLAPSAVTANDQVRTFDGLRPAVRPKEMEPGEIREIVTSYGTAARRAIEAGFDGVELHAGNGYLPCQFLSSNTNLRRDSYGGSIRNRCRFVVEVLDRMISAAGSARVGVKISPGFIYHDTHDEDPIATYAHLSSALNDLDLAYVHVQIPLDFIQVDALNFDPVALVREHYRGVIFAGGNLDRSSAADMVRSGRADAAVFGRRFIANPDLPKRIRLGLPENEWDVDTLHVPGPKGYVDYPAYDEK